MGYHAERILFICQVSFAAETLLGMPVLGQGALLKDNPRGFAGAPTTPSSLTPMRDHPMPGPLVALDVISKLKSSNVSLVSVVVVKCDSKILGTPPIKGWCLCPFLLILGRYNSLD